MKKNRIANLIMTAIIVLIAAAGILTAGYIQGWFDRADNTQAVLTDIRGIVNMQRDGVAYGAANETVLRSGDRIVCESGATARIDTSGGSLVLGEKASVQVTDPQSLSLTVSSGEIFIDTVGTITLSFDGKTIDFTDTAALLSVRSGAQSIHVYAGSVEEAQAGEQLEWIGDIRTLSELSIKSLNDFSIEQIRIASAARTLIFTNEELEQLQAERIAQMQQAVVQPETSKQEESVQEESSEEESVQSGGESSVSVPEASESHEEEPPAGKTPQEESSQEESSREESSQEESSWEESSREESSQEESSQEEPVLTCTISIRCDTILDNWDNLDSAKAGYVPSTGVILYETSVEFSDGETVFDVLARVCSSYGIQLEYSWTPMYGSYYIEGIHHLYEFDCGSESGWMYKVNGWFPNYGCSSYTLQDGDNIVWCYTCNGLGADVGAQ